MGEESFAPSEIERRIFVTALRQYSDQCFAPKLTPSCPFYVLTASGPACGEQCHDILAEYADFSDDRSWDLGDGLVIHERPARRPRRGPEPTTRPFDAAAISMRDQDKTTDARHTISLLSDLRNRFSEAALRIEDPAEHAYLIEAYVGELEKRGFSGEHLTSVGAEISARGASVALAIHRILVDSGNPEPLEAVVLKDEWLAVQRIVLPPDQNLSPHEILTAVNAPDFLEGLIKWMSMRTLPELAAGVAPPVEVVQSGMGSLANPGFQENARIGRWIFDRFTQTYLQNWKYESLELEWKYLHSKVKGCSSSEVMRMRRVDAVAVSREIANRITSGHAERPDLFRLADFTPVTIEYLRGGNYSAAATIHEGLSRINRNDPFVWNNLGFCLLPIDSRRAQEALSKADVLSDSPQAVTRCNRALAYFISGDSIAAMDMAISVVSLPVEENLWLWDVDSSVDSFRLVQGQNSVEYASALIERIQSSARGDDASVDQV